MHYARFVNVKVRYNFLMKISLQSLSRVTSYECEFQSMSYEFKSTSSNSRVASSNSRVGSSNLQAENPNLRMTSSNPRVASPNTRVRNQIQEFHKRLINENSSKPP